MIRRLGLRPAASKVTEPSEPKLGLHLIESLIGEGFDVAHTRHLPDGRATGLIGATPTDFVYRRLMHNEVIPNVPIFMNTYYPPNQPTMRRCYQLGEALRRRSRRGTATSAWRSSPPAASATS